MGDSNEDIDPERPSPRRDKAQAASDRAAVASPFGGVILRLRKRALAARRSARVFLAGLVLTVLAGLSYYLLLPFWEASVDNRRATLDATLAGIEEEDDNLDRDRNALIRRDASEEDEGPGLSTLLRGQFERLPVPGLQSVSFQGTAALPDGGLLVYGTGSTLMRLPVDGGAPERLTVPGSQSVFFEGTAALTDGGLLFYGDESTLLRMPAEGGAPERIKVPGSDSVRFQGAAPVPGGGLLVYGTQSTLIRVPADGGAPERLPVPGSDSVRFFGTAALPDGGLLVYGTQSTLIRLAAEGGAPEKLPVPGSQSVYFDGTAALPDGGLLIYGDESTLMRLPAEGGAPERLTEPEMQVFFNGTATLPDGALLVYGDRSTLLRLSPEGGAPDRLPVPGSQTVYFTGTATLPDGGLLVHGRENTLLRLPAGGGAPEKLPVPGSPTAYLNGTAALPDGGLLIYGDERTLLRLPAEGGAPEKLPVPGSQSVYFTGTATLPDGGLLVYGDRSRLLRQTDRWSEAASALQPSAGADGDATLARFLDDTLPAHIRDWPPVADIRDAFAGIENRRAALDILRARTGEQLDALEEFPYAQWRRARLRLDFASFLDTCRGPGNQEAGITEACLSAWQERQSSDETWWKTLADQVPPGILILFLLATTGALYRYNLRLAGFHDSRADALELLAQGRSDAELRDILATSPGEAVNLATVFLAADKVEQGTIRAKLGQAEVELAKAIGTDR